MQTDASQTQTSVEFTRPLVSIPLGLVMGGCLTFAIGVFLGGRMGASLLNGWALGFATTAVVASLATRADLWIPRLVVTILLVFLAPTVLIFSGNRELGVGWLAMGGAGYSLVVPAVEWACGTLLPVQGAVGSISMALAGSAKSRDPLIGASFVGIMVFALPGERMLMAGLAAGYFASLFALVSFGRMVRETGRAESQRIVIEGGFLRRWSIACCAFLLILGLSGGLSALGSRLLPPKPTDMPSGGAGVKQNKEGIARGESPADQPPTEQQLLEGPSKTSGRSKPARQKPPPPPDKEKQKKEDLRLLIWAAGLAAVAALLLWVARKFGDRILGFCRRLLIEPIARRIVVMREGARRKRRETEIQRILVGLPNPFAELASPNSARSKDLPNLYEGIVADAYLIGSPREASETIGVFLGRLATVHALPRTELETVRRVCTRAEFAAGPPTQDEVFRAFEAGAALRAAMRKRVSQEMLPKRQAQYLRIIAETALDLQQE